MRNLVLLLFLIAFLGLVAGVNIYISRRFSYYFGIAQIRRIYAVSGLLTVFMLGAIRMFTNSVNPFGHAMYMAASVLVGFALYLMMSFILIDLIHLFVKVKPVLLGISAVALAAIVFSYGIWHAYNPRITTIEIPIKGITKEIRALHISDIHLGHFRGEKYMRKIVEATRGLGIDIVFMTGDLFDGKIRPQEEAISPLEQLGVPVYFVEGNHDGYAGPETIKQKLRKRGMIVLENEVVYWGEWQIIGLDYMEADSPSHDRKALREGSAIRDILPALGIDPAKPSILLHHSPIGIEYTSQHGIDLYLAGHTHAGQLFPVTFLAKFMYPYYKGLYEYGKTRIYVSQGAGTFGPPLRVGTRNELAVIILKPA
jgi:predicted MPP superfamily phosphohydrolase